MRVEESKKVAVTGPGVHYEVRVEESKKAAVARPGVLVLSNQCSTTELQLPNNHQPSQSSMRTAQVLVNAESVTTPLCSTGSYNNQATTAIRGM